MKPSSREKKREEKSSMDPLQNELESILANRIDEDYIASITGVKDLNRVEYIAIQIDTSIQSIFDLTDLLPNMKHLVLDNSVISSIRDLGVGLRHLSSLSLSGCGLHDLDGIGVLTGLQELNLSDNYISDITPLTFHEHLQNLNLGGNKIIDLSFGSVLASCAGLRSLFLSRNPVERVSKYRLLVAFLVPGLEMLDGSPTDQQLAKKLSSTIIEETTSELKLIEEEMEEESRLEAEIYDANNGTANSAEYNKKKLTVSLSNNNNNNNSNNNPAVSFSIHKTWGGGGSHSNSNSFNLSMTASEMIPDTGSELTHGSAIVLAGNVAAAMRKRRNQSNSEKSHTSSSSLNNEGGGENKEFESALEVLDSALLPSNQQNHRQNNHNNHNHNKEGDITEQILGPNSPVKRSSRGAKNNANTGLSLELNTDFLTSPSTKPPLSTNKSYNSNSIHNDMMLGDPNTKLLSATRRPQSAFSGMTYRFTEKPMTPANHTSDSSFSPRPTTAMSSAMSSPRQINSSRPQSAVNPSLFENLKFSFNHHNNSQSNSSGGDHALPTDRPKSGRKPSRSRQHDDNDSEDDDDDEPYHHNSHNNQYRKIVPLKTEEKLFLSQSQQKGSSIVHLDIVKRNKSDHRLIFPLDDFEGQQSNRRPSSSSNSSFQQEPNTNNKGNYSARSSNHHSNSNNSDIEEEHSSDDEDIAINHRERFRLMSAAAARPGTSATKTHHQILQQLKTSSSTSNNNNNNNHNKSTRGVNGIAILDDSGDNSDKDNKEDDKDDADDDRQLFKKTSMSELATLSSNTTNNNNNNNNSNHNKTLSSQIGMSLGFNLAGSLAAIDQWVQDMSSGDDDEEEHEDHRNRSSKIKNNNNKGTAKIQIIGVPNYSSFNDNSNNSGKDKILSRDTILTMCTNSTNPTPRGGQSDYDDTTNNSLMSEEPTSSSSRKRDSSASRRSASTAANYDNDNSFEVSRSAVKERPVKPAITNKETFSVGNKQNKMALVQKKHLTTSENNNNDITFVNTPEFEERLVTTVPLTSASTSVLFTHNKKSNLTANANPAHTAITAQSVNNLDNMGMGKGALLTNEDIVELLRKPPKSVPVLRTKTSFQEFFRGIDRRRFESCLKEAYSDIDDIQERDKKVLRRLELMEGV